MNPDKTLVYKGRVETHEYRYRVNYNKMRIYDVGTTDYADYDRCDITITFVDREYKSTSIETVRISDDSREYWMILGAIADQIERIEKKYREEK